MLTTLTKSFLTTAAGATDEFYLAQPLPGKWRIVEAFFAPDTAAAASGTNYAILTLSSNQAAGGSFTVIAETLTTAAVAMAVDTAREFVLDADLERTIPQGGTIKIAKTEAGTGALIHGSLIVVLEKVPN